MMLNKNKGNLLIDYYGSLLTKHQLDILSAYFIDDLSMNEIAEEKNISKSAVSDIIKRSIKQLEEYEAKLKLIEQNERLDLVIKELENGNNKDKKLAKELLNIFRR